MPQAAAKNGHSPPVDLLCSADTDPRHIAVDRDHCGLGFDQKLACSARTESSSNGCLGGRRVSIKVSMASIIECVG